MDHELKELANALRIIREQREQDEREHRNGLVFLLLVGAALIALAFVYGGAASGAEPSVAEKPLPALQADTARSLEELKASARTSREAVQRIRQLTHEDRPEIDFGVAGMGMYSVAAPKGEYLALRLARLCHEQYELPPKNVIVTVYYGPKNVAEVEPHENAPHRAIRVYVEAESGTDATVLVERAIDALAGRPQRTLEPAE